MRSIIRRKNTLTKEILWKALLEDSSGCMYVLISCVVVYINYDKLIDLRELSAEIAHVESLPGFVGVHGCHFLVFDMKFLIKNTALMFLYV